MNTQRWNTDIGAEESAHRRSNTQNQFDQTQTGKYEINETVKGQAVGGPKLKPKLTMWDMLTLYDTQKKRVEDEEAFQAHKK
jgi:hypothetical protein